MKDRVLESGRVEYDLRRTITMEEAGVSPERDDVDIGYTDSHRRIAVGITFPGGKVVTIDANSIIAGRDYFTRSRVVNSIRLQTSYDSITEVRSELDRAAAAFGINREHVGWWERDARKALNADPSNDAASFFAAPPIGGIDIEVGARSSWSHDGGHVTYEFTWDTSALGTIPERTLRTVR